MAKIAAPLFARTGEGLALRVLVLLVAIMSVARIVLASNVGLGIDESYTVATSRIWALSTYDHPPLAWWLAGGAAKLFGSEAPLAVRLPFITLGAVSLLLAYDAGRYLYSARAGLFAAIVVSLAPVLGWTSGSMVLPDGPLLAALFAGLCCVVRALFGDAAQAPRWWLLAGVAAGAACLSKLHGVFLLAGTGLFVLTSPQHRHWMWSPWPYAAALVCGLIFSPVLIWNAEHGWISFAFQAGRAKASRLDFAGPFLALGGQALFLLPWVWVALAISLIKAARLGPRQPRDWLLFCLAIGPIAVFTLIAFAGTKTLFHWAAPGYLFACILLGRDIARGLEAHNRSTRTWLRASVASIAVVFVGVLLVAHLPWPALAGPGGKPIPYPLIETQTWGELRNELSSRGLLQKSNVFVAALKWHEAARADVALAGQLPVRCLCTDARGYGVIYDNAQLAGQDAVIVSSDPSDTEVRAVVERRFLSLTDLGPISITHAGRPVQTLRLYLGKQFR